MSLNRQLEPPAVIAVSGAWVTAHDDGTVEVTGRIRLKELIELAVRSRLGASLHGAPFISMLGPV